MDISDLKTQIDIMYNNGIKPVNFYFNYSDYLELLGTDGRFSFSTNPHYFNIVTAGGNQVFINYEQADFQDDDYYYHFRQKTFVSLASWDKMVGVIEDGPKLKTYTGRSMYLSRDAMEYWTKIGQSEIEPSCYCRNRKAVWLIISAFWLCLDCGKDLGTLTESELREARRGLR